MTNDNRRTLACAINHICEIYKQDPTCLTTHDLNTLESLKHDADWLLREAYRCPVNTPRHHQVFDRIHQRLRKLEKKCSDYFYQKKWQEELIRQMKYSPDQPRDDHGRWTDGGSGSSGAEPSRAPHSMGGSQTGVSTGNQPAASGGSPKPKPLNVNNAADHLSQHAKPGPDHHPQCAKYVREAIQAGGIKITADDLPAPDVRSGDREAKDYGKMLDRIGFNAVIKTHTGKNYPPDSYEPRTGDVAIIQPAPGHPAGHMAMYNGDIWISDFKQKGFWPASAYVMHKPSYAIYRHPSH